MKRLVTFIVIAMVYGFISNNSIALAQFKAKSADTCIDRHAEHGFYSPKDGGKSALSIAKSCFTQVGEQHSKCLKEKNMDEGKCNIAVVYAIQMTLIQAGK